MYAVQENLNVLPTHIKVDKTGYELVNKKEMDLNLPNETEKQEQELEIILAKKGYLNEARVKYYEIAEDYIRRKYNTLINELLAKKEKGWEKQKAKLIEEKERIKKQLEEQVEDYIRTNKDDLSKKELKARQLFDEGKIDESIKLRESLNSEETILTAQKNIKIAKKNRAKAQNIITDADKEEKDAKSKIQSAFRNLNELANGYVLQYNFEKAEETYRKIVELDSTDFKKLYDLAYFLRVQNKNIDEVITILRQSFKLTKNIDQEILVHGNLGKAYTYSLNYEEALKNFKNAIKKCDSLKKYFPIKYEKILGVYFNDVGAVYKEQGDFENSLKYHKKSYKISEKLSITHDDINDLELLPSLNSLGILYSNVDKGKAIEYYLEALNISKNYARIENEEDLRNESSLLFNIGTLYLQVRAPHEAIKYLNTALDNYTQLSKKNMDKYEPLHAMSHLNLGSAYLMLENFKLSKYYFIKALNYYQDLAKINYSTYKVDLALCYKRLGDLYSKNDTSDYLDALSFYQKSNEIYSELLNEKYNQYLKKYININDDIASVLYYQNEYLKSILVDFKMLPFYLDLVKKNPEQNEETVDLMIMRLVIVRSQLRETNAKELYEFNIKYIELISYLKDYYPEKYSKELVITNRYLGDYYKDINDYDKAKIHYLKSYEINQWLNDNYVNKHDPYNYKKELAWSIYCLISLQKKFDKGDVEEINSLIIEIDRAEKLYLEDPTKRNTDVFIELLNSTREDLDMQSVKREINNLKENRKLSDSTEKIDLQKQILLKYEYLNKQYGYLPLEYGREMGLLSMYYMTIRKFEEAEETAKLAINPPHFKRYERYDLKISWVQTRLALALLYQGKYEEAKEIYIRLKDEPYGNATYKEAFLEDLDALRKEGITHPDVEKIRKLLNK